VEVVRPGPDVDENQRPEVQDRQTVGVHGPLGRLGQEVVHHAEERRRQEEGDRVVAVPPLHEGVLDPRVDRVALHRPRHDHEVVEDVEHGDGHERGDVEPQRDVEVPLASAGERAEEVCGEHNPDDGDGDVDGPLEFRVLLRLAVAEGQRHGRGDDDGLPPPEVQPAQRITPHAGLEEALRGVVHAREDGVAREGEDHRVGVKRAQPAEGQPRSLEVEGRQDELERDQEAHSHADKTPQHGDQQEHADDPIVVDELFDAVAHARALSSSIDVEGGNADRRLTDPGGRAKRAPRHTRRPAVR
jgi:23S rRNA (cytosine1962-C5)-methyltransferase